MSREEAESVPPGGLRHARLALRKVVYVSSGRPLHRARKLPGQFGRAVKRVHEAPDGSGGGCCLEAENLARFHRSALAFVPLGSDQDSHPLSLTPPRSHWTPGGSG